VAHRPVPDGEKGKNQSRKFVVMVSNVRVVEDLFIRPDVCQDSESKDLAFGLEQSVIGHDIRDCRSRLELKQVEGNLVVCKYKLEISFPVPCSASMHALTARVVAIIYKRKCSNPSD
jgi:hypothetical protein